ncbi:MAG TPA: glycosyltransferase family 39 protein [Bryobacteraceae bacterium]|nr:glycosyltransferase family 39 protein [Bryobacteraceae bacterium]
MTAASPQPWRWIVLGAIGLYSVLGGLFIAQKPGLHYDEALLVAGAVHLRHSTAEITLAHVPNSWICVRRHCLPLMAEGSYIGAVKEYLAWPLVAAFGPRVPLIRAGSMLMAILCIWGIARFLDRQVSPAAGAAAALVLAIHPAYLSMTVFDNGATSPMLGAFGLLCAAASGYIRRNTVRAAFWIGAAAGLGVWARANFVWTAVALFAAASIVLRRRLLLPWSHWMGVVAGGIIGGFPFLVYQIASRGGTWQALDEFVARRPLRELLQVRLYNLGDTLLADGEHRAMWTQALLPAWQLWLFPTLVAAACAVCLAAWLARPGRLSALTGFARLSDVSGIAALTLILLGAVLFLSRQQVTEHHLIALVPIAAAVVVLAGCVLLTSFTSGTATLSLRVALAAVALLYAGCALYWQAAGIRGLRETGGVGPWSDANVELTRYVEREYPGRDLRILDWGLKDSLYVLSDGRIQATELFRGDFDQQHTWYDRPWIDEIRAGGTFLLNGPRNRQMPASTNGFLKVLAQARPAARWHTIAQRDGATFAQIVDIEPNAALPESAAATAAEDSPPPALESSTLLMSDTSAEARLSGVYGAEPAGWRWTRRAFSAILPRPQPEQGAAQLTVDLFIPDAVLRKTGPLTLSARLGVHELAPETYSQPGQGTYVRIVPAGWMQPGPNRFEFQLDKFLAPSAQDTRELGIVVSAFSLEPY